jgi:hypothetical protein
MFRIIFGIILLLAMLNQFVAQKAPVFAEVSEMQGYVAAQIVFLVLAIWLIYSGIKKRKAHNHAAKGADIKEDAKKEGMLLTDFFKSFFGDYKTFLRESIELKRPPYWLCVIWLYGIARVAIRLNTGIGTTFDLQNWLPFWASALLLGIVIGFIGYWVIGSIFHLGVLLAGGHKKAKTSRLIYVYCWMPHALVVTATFLAAMLGQRENYFLNGGIAANWFYPATFASLYSIILGYIGATEIQKTKKIRSILLFILLPFVIHAGVILYVYVLG